MRLRRLLALLAVVALGVLVPTRTASAHADLSTGSPEDQSVLETAPTAITLQFTESVTIRPDSVRVLDPDGGRVDAGQALVNGSTVEAPLDGTLPNGGYVVAWRAISADGHPVRGAFTFSVGSRATIREGLADEAFADSADQRDETLAAVLRGLSYLGILGATGMVLVGAALRRSAEPGPVGPVASGFGVLGLLGVVAQVPVQASLITGRGWGSVTEPGVLSLVMADGVGWSLALTGAGLVALLITSGLPFAGPARVLAIGGSVLAPLGLVVTGHTRSMSPAAVAYGSDAAHVVAGAVWFGGLVALVGVVRRRRAAEDEAGATEAVARFSGWAAVTAGAVLVAGTALGWINVGGLAPLTGTTYGRVLLAKVALVGLVLGGAAWNRFRLLPALSAPEDRLRPWHSLGQVLRFEVGAIVVVLALTGALTGITPAATAAEGGIQTVSAPLGGGTAEMIIDPARPGRNDIHVYVLDEQGAPDDRYQSASFAFAYPAQDIGPLQREPVQAGPGHFQVIGTDFDIEGEWTLTLTVKEDRFSEEETTLRFTVG